MGKMNLVCVIDDDDIYVSIVKRMIQKVEFARDAIFFHNGQVALDYFIQNQTNPENLPDLILLDINMPVLDGWQFMDEFKKILPYINKEIAIYIVSSSIDEFDFKRAAEMKEITSFVLKPLTIDKLRSVVREFNGQKVS